MMDSTVESARTNGEPGSKGGLNFRVISDAIRRHPVVLILITMLAGSAACGVWFFLPLPKKTAAVVFHVSPPQSLLGSSSEQRSDYATYKQSQTVLLKSRRTLNEVVNQPDIRTLGVLVAAQPDAIGWLDKHLTIDAKSSPEYLRVTIEGDQEEELLLLINAVAKTYLASSLDRDTADRRKRQRDLQDSLDGAKHEVKRFEERIKEIALLLGGRGPSFLPTEAQRQAAFIKALEELTSARSEEEAARRLLVSAKAPFRRLALSSVMGTAWLVVEPDASLSPAINIQAAAIEDELRQDPLLKELETAATRARQDLLATEDRFQPDAPQVLTARKVLTAAEEKRDRHAMQTRTSILNRLMTQAIQQENARIDKLQSDYDRTKSRLDKAVVTLNEIKQLIEKANIYKLELGELEAAVSQKDKIISSLSDQIERMKIELRVPPRVTISEEPYIISGIEGNRRMKFALLAGMATLIAGFAGLVSWEFRSRRVMQVEEVSSSLGTRLIGTIPPLSASAGIPSSSHAHVPLIEAIDTTRIMLTHATPGGSAMRVLTITSAMAGEGKTTLSGHLAISLARAGFRTLLVDGDMQAPSAHVLFDAPLTPGLSELLRREVEIDAAVRPSPVPGLSVMPAGKWSIATRQALVGDRWRQLKELLETQFDFVVVDTSPLLMVSDAILLARVSDGVVLSVLLGVSQIARVADTVARLNAVGASIAGVVVSNVRSDVYRQYVSRSRHADDRTLPIGDPIEDVAAASDHAPRANA